MQTFDLTPTWSDVLPVIIAVLQNEEAPLESRRLMLEELGRMAKAADAYITLAATK